MYSLPSAVVVIISSFTAENFKLTVFITILIFFFVDILLYLMRKKREKTVGNI